jgi:hypothetical protein
MACFRVVLCVEYVLQSGGQEMYEAYRYPYSQAFGFPVFYSIDNLYYTCS